MRSSDAAWEQYGKSDPYYGVLTADRFKGLAPDKPALDEFFQSGQEHVEHLFSTIRQALDANFVPTRALEFGCGTGRLALPLSDHCPVVGVDISPSMLREAERNCAGREAMFVLSDDTLSRVDGQFDLVHSFIVLQHIPVKRGMVVIDELINRLSPGGVAALHVTYASEASAWRQRLLRARSSFPPLHAVLNVARRRRYDAPMMQMNNYDVARILRTIARLGCESTHIELTQHGVYRGAFIYFQKPHESSGAAD